MSTLLLPNDNDPFDFSGSVGRNGDNDRADVIKAQMLLSSMGEYDLPAPGLPTGWAGEPLFRAIGKVQKANGLPVDGLLLPLRDGRVGENGEGETLMSLQDLLGERLRGQPIPTPPQVDSFFETYARDPDTPPPYRTMEKRDSDPTPPPRTKEVRGPQPEPRIQLLNASMTDEAPASPPAAGEQTAALPAALIPALPYLLGTGALALGAGEYARRQYEKGSAETITPPPSRPLGDTEKEQVTAPPSQSPAIDASLQGRPAADKLPDNERLIPPETKDWISGLPPAQQPVAEGLAGIIVELNPHGSRGKPETEKANRIMVRTCLEELQAYPDLAGRLEHVAGASLRGDEEGKYMKEEVIRASEGKTFSRPDSTFGRFDAEKKVDQASPYTARMNTVDIKKTGDEHDQSGLTANEGRRFDKLETNIKVGVAGWARKMKPGESEAQYADYVASRCRAMWDDLDGKLRRDGLLQNR
ncbi:MAG: peptidoglycan-binding protein [Ferrovibrio sp.]|uniref:peptidoglycan-binding domain-containing protein n=1 Tax=Ferrovibrio sp. TaxID=1917215 RepID=UPI00260568B9|nr:peptidoglycan-binding protein [Ferrovibrio sp.]MCW0233823.1 peptidoglycan-binding protein [Ferrovibrio sp.]